MHSSISSRSQNASFLSSCTCGPVSGAIQRSIREPKDNLISEPAIRNIPPAWHQGAASGTALLASLCQSVLCTASVSLLLKFCACNPLQPELTWGIEVIKGHAWKTWRVPRTSSSQETPKLHMSYGQVRLSTGTPVQYLESTYF